MARFQDLTHTATPLNGNAKIPLYSSGANDEYATPLDIAQQPVQFGTTITGVTYTLLSADIFKVVPFTSASSVAVTIPNLTTAGIGIGSVGQGYQLGAGRLTFTAVGGVTALYPKDAAGIDCKITRAANSPWSYLVLPTGAIIFTGDLVSS